MDHFPIPAGSRHAKFAYLQHKEYDNGTFCDYPKRQGWSSSDLSGEPNSHGKRYGGRSTKEINSFFQTWLFFGALIRTFRCMNIKVTTSDFVTTNSESGNSYLSTKKMAENITKWKTKKLGQQWDDQKKFEEDYMRDQLLSQTRKNYKRMPMSPIAAILADHRKYIIKYLGKNSGVSSEVRMACISVQFSMGRGAVQNYASWGTDFATRAEDFTVGSQSYMRKRMVDNAWCPAEAGKFTRDLDIEGQYYISCFRSPRYEDDHSRCSENNQRCGYKAKNWVYKTQHVRSDCHCSMIVVPKDVVTIIQDGHVPVMKYADGKLRATAYEGKKNRYVAISHVLSDGLGNDKQNALPKCQLELIQKRADNVDSARKNSAGSSDKYASTSYAGFWMDTLCVPVADEHKALRDSQIQKMRRIYKSAACVLVLDKWITSMSKSADLVEKSAKLYASNWQHRLWTCQEGYLATTLYVQFKDGVQTIKQMEKDSLAIRSDPQRSRLPETVLSWIPAFKDLGIETMEVEYRIPAIIPAIRPRTTSKKKDETVCIATLLGLSPEKLLKISQGSGTEEEQCDKRMAKLIDLVETWPQGYIFTSLPRLNIPGYRWAPRSLLGTNLSQDMFESGEDKNADWRVASHEGKIMIPGHGLLVCLPSYKLGKVKETGHSYLYISDGDKHYKVSMDKGEFKDGKEYVILRSPGTKPIQAVVCSRDGILKKNPKTLPYDAPKLKYLSHAVMESKISAKDRSTSFKHDKKHEWVIG